MREWEFIEFCSRENSKFSQGFSTFTNILFHSVMDSVPACYLEFHVSGTRHRKEKKGERWSCTHEIAMYGVIRVARCWGLTLSPRESSWSWCAHSGGRCVSVLLSLSLSSSQAHIHTNSHTHSRTHQHTCSHSSHPGLLAGRHALLIENLASFLKLHYCWPSRLDMILSGLLPPPHPTVPTHPWARTTTHTQNSHYPWLLGPLWPPTHEHGWGPHSELALSLASRSSLTSHLWAQTRIRTHTQNSRIPELLGLLCCPFMKHFHRNFSNCKIFWWNQLFLFARTWPVSAPFNN